MIDPLSFKFIDSVPDDKLKKIIPEQAYAIKLTKKTFFICLALADVKHLLCDTANGTFMNCVHEFARQGKSMTGADNFFYNYRVAVQKTFKEKKVQDYLCFSTRSSRDGNDFYKDLSVDKLYLKDAPQYSSDHYSELLLDTEVTNEDFKAERCFLNSTSRGKRNDDICNQGPANELMLKTTNYVKLAVKAQIQTDPSHPNFIPLLLGKNGFTTSSTLVDYLNHTYLPLSQYLREPEALFNLKLFSDVIHDVALPSKEEAEDTAKELYRLRQRHCVRIGTF